MTARRRDPWGAACRALEQAAKSGRFSPGQALPIWEMADEVGYSPTPVREALAFHAGRGLFVRKPGQGYVFPPTCPAELDDLRALERLCLESAVRELAPVPARVRRLWTADANRDDLLASIVESSDNAPLRETWRRIVDRIESLEAATGLRQEGLGGGSLAEALAAGDTDAVLAAIRSNGCGPLS